MYEFCFVQVCLLLDTAKYEQRDLWNTLDFFTVSLFVFGSVWCSLILFIDVKEVKQEGGEEKSVKKEKKVKEEIKEEMKKESDIDNAEKTAQSPLQGEVSKEETKDLKMEVEETLEKSDSEKEKINGESEMDVSREALKSESLPCKSEEEPTNKDSEESPIKMAEKLSVQEDSEVKSVKMEVEDLSMKKENEDPQIKKESDESADSSEKKDEEEVPVKREDDKVVVKEELTELVKEEEEPQDLTSIKEKDKEKKSAPVEEDTNKHADDTEQKVRDIVKDIKRQTTEEMAKLEKKKEKDVKCSYEEEVW